MDHHIFHQFDSALETLKQRILLMGSKVESAISGGIQALTTGDSQLAQRIIASDNEINDLEVKIDELCIESLARFQPAASDLRFITVGLKITKDLERLGDIAVNICERALSLGKEPQLKPYIDLPRMAQEAQKMLKDSLEAFIKRDTTLAESVCKRDDVIDDLDEQIISELIEIMKKDPSSVERAMGLTMVARHLERVADHATNIAEEVIFMTKGQDIRHGRPH